MGRHLLLLLIIILHPLGKALSNQLLVNKSNVLQGTEERETKNSFPFSQIDQSQFHLHLVLVWRTKTPLAVHRPCSRPPGPATPFLGSTGTLNPRPPATTLHLNQKTESNTEPLQTNSFLSPHPHSPPMARTLDNTHSMLWKGNAIKSLRICRMSAAGTTTKPP